MNIVYCTNCISTIGGVERVIAAKASALSKISGNNVWIAVSKRTGTPSGLDERVKVVNLAINYYEGTENDGRLIQLLKLLSKQRLHRLRLKRLFEDIKPDIVISTGQLEKNILTSLRSYSRVLIREMHTASDCRLFYANTVYERLVARICDFLDYRVAISRYDRIVLLTEEDKYRCWNNNKKAIVIPNPLIINHTKRSMLDRKVVLSVGKLTRGKNFAAQIRSWAKIHSRYPDWKLAIVGDGEEKANLDTLIRQLQLTDCVDLIGAKDDISDYMAGASAFVSTSLSEGFGLVIIEAMSFGIPVVSYDCPCGPKDIISDGIDGFLVPTGNEQMLTEKICCLIEHDDMRKRMGECALKSVERFSMDVIVGKWMALFKDLMASKQ